MAKLKILKDGETDITSTDIWRFALHGDHKSYKVASTGSSTITITAGGFSSTGTITHNLNYIPVFFAYIEHDSKGYLVAGSFNNPTIQVASGGSLGYTTITFGVEASSTNLSVTAVANDFLGAPSSNQTFIVRAFFIADEII